MARPLGISTRACRFFPDDFVIVESGENSTCALKDAGTVWCWGSGKNGHPAPDRAARR